MGPKLVKFHVVLHSADDILDFGVPTEFDTSANEGHHVVGKKAAKIDPKRGCKFSISNVRKIDGIYVIGARDGGNID